MPQPSRKLAFPGRSQRPGPAPAARPRPAPQGVPGIGLAWPASPPYQGFGDVPPLGDVFAVLLVSHPDPLFGHHGLGAVKCSRRSPARMPGLVPATRPSASPEVPAARALQVARRGPSPAHPTPRAPASRLQREASARTEVISHLRKPSPTSSPSFRSPQPPTQRGHPGRRQARLQRRAWSLRGLGPAVSLSSGERCGAEGSDYPAFVRQWGMGWGCGRAGAPQPLITPGRARSGGNRASGPSPGPQAAAEGLKSQVEPHPVLGQRCWGEVQRTLSFRCLGKGPERGNPTNGLFSRAA